ncbi:NAD(P)-dependent oxidoreductase [Dysgonomonas macrotermitis]|uniref:Glutamate synthase (NADPH/NADH) small chain n=1 Tax=Dysgonomonas macrotermitis TaxID=1346286 RepID=A0A1M4ZIU8_9BACT|nr:NAD(P)-dependent oxidoreductase [Dysgonomonas macrotermitis]SHF17895.1 glutamate synthase (NADPH/NADH) small chain [Dysgonomonas macrotermitis]
METNLDSNKGTLAALAELHAGYTMKEAIDEAKRCLNCKNPLCVQGCPIEHKIPEWIHQLSKGNIGGAMELLNEKSNLPAICGRVCPHEKQCEGHCILNKKGNPVRVGKLERFIADFDSEMGLSKERLKAKTRGKVAVIGSGPAGLTVAGDLARDGFNVTVFESQKEPGGVLLYGIPEYRLPNEITRREVKKIEALGVTFRNNCVVGEGITVDAMFSEEDFDAVFIGSGTALPQTLSIKGDNLYGVAQSAYFLRMVSLFASDDIPRTEVPLKIGEKVAVIGAGNVAMDTARTALRMGAESVTLIYRRKEEDMPALRSEFLEAQNEGVQFMWESSTQELIGEEVNGKQKLVRMRIETPAGEVTIPMDRVYLAVGSKPANRIVSTTLGIEVNEKGYITTSEYPYGMTTRRGVFAGGDVVHTPQTVVLAMREAKKVAVGIAQYVDAIKLLGVKSYE